MKIKPLLVILAVTSAVTGCEKTNTTEENPANSATNSASSTLQNAKDSTSNAFESAKEAATNAWADVKEGSSNAWSKTTEMTTNAWDAIENKLHSNTGTNNYAEKDDFVAAAGADLDILDQKINTMADKANNASDSVKAEAQAKLQGLRAQRTTLDQKLDAVKNATESDWNDAKTAFLNSYDDFDNSVKQTWQWFIDKVNS